MCCARPPLLIGALAAPLPRPRAGPHRRPHPPEILLRCFKNSIWISNKKSKPDLTTHEKLINVYRMKHPNEVIQEKLTRRSVRDPVTGCLNWAGAKNEAGYGRTWDGETRVYVHRAAWEIANGELLGERCACHHCDNPSCVEPTHLFAGTVADNMQDKTAKGRHGGHKLRGRIMGPSRHRGEKHSRSKLTREKVLAILYRPKARPSELAEEYEISRSAIYAIRHGRLWGWLKAEVDADGF